MSPPRDHGGALDAAIAGYGGQRADWIDLSTGINPAPYPVGDISGAAWTALPDHDATQRLIGAARHFWNVPDGAEILPVHGASAAIARIPTLMPPGQVRIDAPTYNEHAAAFGAAGWKVGADAATARVIVHPDNPTGALWDGTRDAHRLLVIDESFCDVAPDRTHVALANRSGVLVLKSFGKFWGLAGLRLGFVIGDPALIDRLRDSHGPWGVSGPALEIGTRALADHDWADRTRTGLQQEAGRLDTLMTARGAALRGGTTLFRLYDVGDAASWRDRLARQRILIRIFPFSRRLIRLGLPAPGQWHRLEAAP